MKNKYIIKDNYVEMYVTHKKIGTKIVLFDLEFLDKVSSFKTTWFIGISKSGHIDGIKTKVQKNLIRKPIWLHRLIMNCPNDLVVDHRDGNVFDNRLSNLRVVTRCENATNLNSKSNNITGYTNVYKERNIYRVRIGGINFGSYRTLEEAIKVRNEHIKEIFPLRER